MATTQATPQRLELGPMKKGAQLDSCIAAGPWCFAGRETSFEGWETKASFLPDIFEDRKKEDEAIAQAGLLACKMAKELPLRIAPGNALPPAYWELLLLPYAINLSKVLVGHWLEAKALLEAKGEEALEVELLPEDCTFSFKDDQDFVLHGALSPVFTQWIFSLLLRPRLPKAWKATTAAPFRDQGRPTPKEGAKAKLKNLARKLLLSLPFPPLKGLSLKESLRWSLALLHESKGADRTRSLDGHFSVHGQNLGAEALPDLPFDPAPLFLKLLPRSIRELKHPAKLSPMRRPTVRAASILLYEDAAYRQDLAKFRARGGRIVCIQHGGNYGQMERICAMELVEYAQHAFVTWGWNSYNSVHAQAGTANFVPLPHPQLRSLQNKWTGSEKNCIFVGTEMAAACYQLDSHPTPLQFIDYRNDKLRFLSALRPQVLESLLYRPYFPVPGTLQDADFIKRSFPSLRLCTGPLAPQILGCGVLVLDHHGTTLLEAMAADIPLVCYWNPRHWPVTEEFRKTLGAMQEAGIWHPNPAEAAAHLNAIWGDSRSWWQSAKTQAARREFLSRFALPYPEDGDRTWISFLHSV